MMEDLDIDFVQTIVNRISDNNAKVFYLLFVKKIQRNLENPMFDEDTKILNHYFKDSCNIIWSICFESNGEREKFVLARDKLYKYEKTIIENIEQAVFINRLINNINDILEYYQRSNQFSEQYMVNLYPYYNLINPEFSLYKINNDIKDVKTRPQNFINRRILYELEREKTIIKEYF